MPPSSARRTLVDRPALEERELHLRLADVLDRHLERVAVKHDQIRGLADLDGAGLLLESERARAVDRVDRESLGKRHGLLGPEGLRAAAARVTPRDERLDPDPWILIGYRRGPVGARRDQGAGVEQRAGRPHL